MVWDGHKWFGDITSATVEVTAPLVVDAEVVSTSIPSPMVAGQSYTATVTMKNVGTMAWNETSLIRLGGKGDTTGDAWKFGGARFSIPAGTSVVQGQEYPFAFTMTAPTTAGTYTPAYQMVWDGHQWFGDVTSATVDVFQ
jgi:hypothetical protein